MNLRSFKDNKEFYCVTYSLEEKSQVQSSPLREPNQIQDDNEASLDSPIKKTKVTARKRIRIESSSDEENGSPKKGN